MHQAADTELRVNPEALSAASVISSEISTDVSSLHVTLDRGTAAGLLSGKACGELGTSLDKVRGALSGRWSNFSDSMSTAAQQYTQSSDFGADAIAVAGKQFEAHA